ncbi:unnamed protein product [Phytomonas sp. EM1]|nr:unnamed protein product [Phytomonas sp. EM1]|eukprot:CCW59560.1 unnamed protein product [Phytomonas sp. isolate EM1]
MSDPVADFMAITACTDEAIAIQYLSNANFDISMAANVYVAQHGSPDYSSAQPSDSVVSANPSPLTTPMGEAMETTRMPFAIPTGPIIGGNGDGWSGEWQELDMGPAPRSNGLENAGNEALRRLFSTPAFVKIGKPLQTICEQACKKDKWVLVAIRGGNFASACLARDVWNLEVMEVLTDSLVFYEVDIATEYGLELASSYRVEKENLPEIFLVDPQTLHKEFKISLHRRDPSIIDGARVVEEVLLFINANGSPTQRARRMLGEPHDDLDNPTPNRGSGVEVVEVDRDSSTAESAGRKEQNENHAQGEAEAEKSKKAPERSPVEVVTLDAWQHDGGSGEPCFKLRCRLPKSNLTLTLRPETPVRELVRFLAYRVYADDKESYDGFPSVEVRGGFPPKVVPIPERAVDAVGGEITLMEWNGVRSGELLTVHLQNYKS